MDPKNKPVEEENPHPEELVTDQEKESKPLDNDLLDEDIVESPDINNSTVLPRAPQGEEGESGDL
jgi:hypothetical protein